MSRLGKPRPCRFFAPNGNGIVVRAASCRGGNYVVVAREYAGRRDCAEIEKFFVDDGGKTKSEVQFLGGG